MSQTKTKRIIDLYDRHVVPCYRKVPIAFRKGRGAYLWGEDGKRYLDFFSGWAVSGLGHCHPGVASAIRRQVGQLIHVPNNYYHEGHARLAGEIIRNAFPGKVFFCNSGAEAIEGAIKLARTWGYPTRTEIITMHRSFHGRTMGAMSATGQAKFHKGIRPLLGGFKMVPFGDLTTLKKAISKKTAAVLLELVQGEGGVRIAGAGYAKAVEKLCRNAGILLMVDEVQTGMGRTGEMFCFRHYGIRPDVMLLAKALGGGFPIGALVAADGVSNVLKAGTHASTFGGSPIACAAAQAVFDVMREEKILSRVKSAGKRLLRGLEAIRRRHPVVAEVRGMGLMAALELREPATGIYEDCVEHGLLINVTQENVVRMAPPLNIGDRDIERALRTLDASLKRVFEARS